MMTTNARNAMRSALTLGLAIGAFGLAASPAAAQADTASARLGERVYVNGPYVTPLQVVEDTRCTNARRCAAPGELKVKVRVDLGSGSEELVVSTAAPAKVADGAISLVDVSTERTTTQPHRVARSRDAQPPVQVFSFAFAGGL